VKAKSLASIAVTTPPTKTTCYINHAFDPAGLVVTATYDDASIKVVTPDVTTSGFDSSTVGTSTVTVTYTEGGDTKTATFNVTISAPPTIYGGIDYAPVYDAIYYLDNNADIKSYYGNDYDGALAHFVNYGMAEGRPAKSGFVVSYYRSNNSDLAGISVKI
jgi:hypothetical protein